MDLKIRGRIALVTGASSGIGEAVALALASEGATLAIAARRRERLEDVAQQARERGATAAQAFEADLEDPASVDQLIGDVRRAFGDPAILVANSGGPAPGGFLELDLARWDAGYRSTLRNMLQLVQGVVP